MILMNVHLDNLLLFNSFELTTAYPKKIIHSTIPEEHLSERKNFRYKKLIILMGANATGKTAFGKVLMGIFNFIYRKNYVHITDLIEDKTREASFTIDLAYPSNELYRISTVIKVPDHEDAGYGADDIVVHVQSEPIQINDNYEKCLARLLNKSTVEYDSFMEALEAVPRLSWDFEYPSESYSKHASRPVKAGLFCDVLEKTLKTLDPRIQKVAKVNDLEDTYVIKRDHDEILIKNNKIVDQEKLSSGTIEGIGIANIISSMKKGLYDFYYCDEKFSHSHTDVEKAFLSLFIELLGPNQQMFFTTHNSDILEMNLPKHTFAFIKRDPADLNVSCVYASDYLKKNTDSLKNAVENDLFATAPDLQKIYQMREM